MAVTHFYEFPANCTKISLKTFIVADSDRVRDNVCMMVRAQLEATGEATCNGCDTKSCGVNDKHLIRPYEEANEY